MQGSWSLYTFLNSRFGHTFKIHLSHLPDAWKGPQDEHWYEDFHSASDTNLHSFWALQSNQSFKLNLKHLLFMHLQCSNQSQPTHIVPHRCICTSCLQHSSATCLWEHNQFVSYWKGLGGGNRIQRNFLTYWSLFLAARARCLSSALFHFTMREVMVRKLLTRMRVETTSKGPDQTTERKTPWESK